MSEHGEQLDAEHVRAPFQELSNRLAASGAHAQLFVVGGAAMALAYGLSCLTRDVDAVFVPATEVRHAAEAIAVERGLEPDWHPATWTGRPPALGHRVADEPPCWGSPRSFSAHRNAPIRLLAV